MAKVLLTGGSGFVAAHILDQLLERGFSVVTTVRSQDKASGIRRSHADVPQSQLDFVIVPDIAQEGAFEEVVKSEPPFKIVIHTASPFHFNTTNPKKDLIDPAVIGTVDILKSIKKNAPEVKQVIITSSFAAIIDGTRGRPGHTYTEQDWNPITEAEACAEPIFGYRGAKTFAEKAAWDFLKTEKPNFSISTICPPTVYGPVAHSLPSLRDINTSNERIRDTIMGHYKDANEISGASIWVDVRDVALAHILAAEVEAASNERFFVTAGFYTNREVVEIIRDSFPELSDSLPPKDVPGADFPETGVYGYDNSKSMSLLGLKYRSLRESITDTVKSLSTVPASI